jgi:hypothetical protein
MAMQPPGPPGLGGGLPPPPRPPMGGPPGMGAPPMPPQAAPPPPPPQSPPGAGGLGPASPLGSLVDLSASMGPGWQQVDWAVRSLKSALRSTDFQKTPAVVAVIQSLINTASELISHYTSGTAGAKTSPTVVRREGGRTSESDSSSADADAQPSAEPTESSDSGEM